MTDTPDYDLAHIAETLDIIAAALICLIPDGRNEGVNMIGALLQDHLPNLHDVAG